MKAKLQKIVDSIFSVCLITAILGGGIIFVMFVIALIMGGSSGEALASNASKVIMPYFIRIASLSVLCGLISIYISGKHPLSLEED